MWGFFLYLLRSILHPERPIDGKTYFQLTGDDEVGLVVNHELEDAKVKIVDGRYYVEDSVVGTYINSRFYWDSQQQVMLYTLPNGRISDYHRRAHSM